MGYQIKTITGELKEYAFDFGGVIALRNFTARTNGNRLIIQSAENANFTILDALVNEVEIDGVVYDNVTAAQEALQRLVFNPRLPVIMTKQEQEKLDNLIDGAEPNLIEVIKKNGIALPINSKEVDIAVPTKVSELVNDSAFQTETQVNAKISAIQKMKKEVVTSLPVTGVEDIIYLTPVTNGVGDNIMNEYMWINNDWEKIGDTATVLNVESITDSEIDALLVS